MHNSKFRVCADWLYEYFCGHTNIHNMQYVKNKITNIQWHRVQENMNDRGFALVPGFLTAADCRSLLSNYDTPQLYRKTVVMERYRFGLGEYKYFNYPLPDLIQTIRENVYTHLAPIANHWMKMLGIENQFPASFATLQILCSSYQQTKPTVLMLKYEKGGHNTLHQDLYGDVYFPMQLVLFLNEPGEDYTGGEFVLLEQIPRAQSRAIVLQPKMGDMLLFTTQFRPVRGKKGCYRANIKHGVSELHGGVRHTLGIIFHDALS